jgi:hypothetical protein
MLDGLCCSDALQLLDYMHRPRSMHERHLRGRNMLWVNHLRAAVRFSSKRLRDKRFRHGSVQLSPSPRLFRCDPAAALSGQLHLREGFFSGTSRARPP